MPEESRIDVDNPLWDQSTFSGKLHLKLIFISAYTTIHARTPLLQQQLKHPSIVRKLYQSIPSRLQKVFRELD